MYTFKFSVSLMKELFNSEKFLNKNNECIFSYMYMVFTTEGFFEVAIESWPEFRSDALTN